MTDSDFAALEIAAGLDPYDSEREPWRQPLTELLLPSTVVRRNKLDISLGYCNEIQPSRLRSLGPAVEIRVNSPGELIEFLTLDAEDGRVHFVNHLPIQGEEDKREWEYVCFARKGEWTIFCSVFSTSLAFNPLFGDGKRRRLCSGGTRIIGKKELQDALHGTLASPFEELEQALRMGLDLSEAMTEKNLSNGFNVGGSKTLVYVERISQASGQEAHIPTERSREFARFMAEFHNSILQSLPLFIGTGSDLNFKAHYYDFCSRISPSYVGNPKAAKRWGREAALDTTEPTAKGVMACIDAVSSYLGLEGTDQSILIKGVGGIGSRVTRYYVEQGWRVFVTDTDPARIDEMVRTFGERIVPVDEDNWMSVGSAAIFSPNSSSGSLTAENLPKLKALGVRAVIGGENNIRARGVDEESVYRDTGILTFADFLLNGGGAWIVDAEMVERPAQDVEDWIKSYQIPTLLKTIELAEASGRSQSPESIFIEFIRRKVKELVA